MNHLDKVKELLRDAISQLNLAMQHEERTFAAAYVVDVLGLAMKGIERFEAQLEEDDAKDVAADKFVYANRLSAVIAILSGVENGLPLIGPDEEVELATRVARAAGVVPRKLETTEGAFQLIQMPNPQPIEERLVDAVLAYYQKHDGFWSDEDLKLIYEDEAALNALCKQLVTSRKSK